jgi:hypothetical protein
MQKTGEQKNEVSDKKSLFEIFTEIMGWLQIVASPFLAAVILGTIIYFSKPTTTRLVIAVAIVTIGLVIGIIWATRVWKKKGTIHYMSRIMATPELDNRDEDQK